MPITEDRVARLREFGLSEYAARAYLALLDLGVSEASEISKLTKVPTSKIYHVLDQLHEKGLVEILPEFPKKYAPVAFSEFLEKVRREHADAVAQIERERTDLASLFSVVGNVEIGDRGNFTVVRGRRNVLEKTSEIIESANDFILVVGTAGTPERDLHHREEIRKARARGVAVRYLVPLEGADAEAFADLALVAEIRERDVRGAPRGIGVGIVIADGRQAFIVNYLPDDASIYSGKDVGIFTDHGAIVAALEAVLGPVWSAAAPYGDVRREAPSPRAVLAELGLEGVFDAVGDAALVAAADGRVLLLNDRAAALLGVPPEPRTPLPLSRILPDVDVARTLDGGTVVPVRAHAVRADGQRVPVEASLAPAGPGNGYLLAFLRDGRAAAKAGAAGAMLEEGFRRAFEDAGIGKAITAPDGRILQVNAALAGIVGRRPEELVGTQVLDVLHRDDREAALRRFDEVVADGVASCRFEARSPDRGEGPRWVKVTVSCVRDPTGRPAEIIVQLDDVTSTKVAEVELKRALSLLTATLESTADGILVVDREGRVVSHNQRFVQIWRVPDIAAAGRDVRATDAFTAQLKDPEAYVRKIRESDERPEAETFDIVEFKDGRVFERHSQPQRVGSEVVGRVWCLRDVTGQRRVEQALRQAEVYYRGLVQSARAVFWRADPATSDFTFVSREAENLLGYPVGRWLSETGFWTDRIHPEDRDWVVSFRRQSTREKRAHEYEYRMVAEDGRTVWVRDIVRVAVSDDKPVELVGVMIDITDRKEAEESLRDHSDRLSELVTTQRDIAHGKLTLDDLLLLACVRAQRITKAEAGVLGLVRDGRRVVGAASGSAAATVGHALDPFAALAFETGQTVRCDDAEIDPRVDGSFARETKTRAVAVVPLKRGDQVVGVLEVTSDKASAFGERDLDMLGILGGLVTAAIGASGAEVTLKPKPTAARTERKTRN